MNGSHPGLPLDPYQYRADFPILSAPVHGDVPLVYFDNAASSQRPESVLGAMENIYRLRYANVHRGIHTLSEAATEAYELARERVRQFVNANTAGEIVFTSGTTASINLVAYSWGQRIGSNDEILLTEMEHHSNLVPWQMLAERTGCTIRYLPVTDDGRLDLDQLDDLLTSRTRMVALTSVSNVLGTINPIQEITSRAHAVGAVVMLDAAQQVPHARLDVQALGVDLVAFSGHKMLGPSGIGVLYGREDLLREMPPFLGGGSMIRRVRLDGFEAADPPARFEAGTPAIVPAIGLSAAIDYLEMVGLDTIAAYEHALAQQAHHVLSKVDGVSILGPDLEHKAGIVCFVVEGVHAHDVAHLLDRRFGVAIRAGHHCAMPLHKRFGITASNRASFYFYNTPKEVDTLAEALDDVRSTFRRRKRREVPSG